jgi:MraZ protein
MPFAGKHELTIDAKNRLVIPSKFRDLIDPSERQGLHIIASPVRGEQCLRLYTKSGWKDVSRSIMQQADKAENPAVVTRFFAERSDYATLDKQSRIVVPQQLIDYAAVERNVVMVGNLAGWLEVWSPGSYQEAARAAQAEVKERDRLLWPRQG